MTETLKYKDAEKLRQEALEKMKSDADDDKAENEEEKVELVGEDGLTYT